MELHTLPSPLSSSTRLIRESTKEAAAAAAAAPAPAAESATRGAATLEAAAHDDPLPAASREGGQLLWVDVDMPPAACASSSNSPLDWHAVATHCHVSPAGDATSQPSAEPSCGCTTPFPHSASLGERSPRPLPFEGEGTEPKEPSTSLPSTPLESHVAASTSRPRRRRRSSRSRAHSSHSTSVELQQSSSRDGECCTGLEYSLDRAACAKGKQCHVAFTVPAEFNRAECQDGCLRCLVLRLSEEEWREKRQAALGTRQGSGNLQVMVEHLETKLRNL